jgi:methylglutamate dehydrogenase subunit C
MSPPFRLGEGGRVDRTQTLDFTFDGKALSGHPGDTLASALLANGVRLVGRSFKYHRRRGILSCGAEEPSALVELRTGARREPNTAATTIELFDGLVARSQNRWPSLGLDVMAATRWLSPLFPAGFYYKTFMWPGPFWEPVYERLIRRAAGLGRASREPDPDAYETAHAHCDVLVVGAGPAGLMAALAAGRAGARVILAEQRPWLGGQLAFERMEIAGSPAQVWVDALEEALFRLAEVRVMRRTTITGYYDHNVLAALERVADHLPVPPPHQPRQRFWTIRAGQVVLAAGAHERPLVFSDNDRPGVMLASAMRAYLNRFAVAPGRRVLIATNNDDAYRTALDLAAAGIHVVAIADCREAPGPLAGRAREVGINVLTRTVIERAAGVGKVGGAELRRVDGERLGNWTCDAIATSGGWSPAVHLASQSGAKPVWEEATLAFVPGPPVQAERSAGAARGTSDLAGCLAEGAEAGAEAARAAGFTEASAPAAPMVESLPEAPLEPLWEVAGAGKAFVDLQNDVTAADIRLAAREGYRAAEHAKRYTTLGMATDQGKTANVNGHAILAAARGEPVAAIGTTTFRPPYTPVAIGAMVGHERGIHFQPIRRTSLHDWHERADATFVEAGHWLRPQYYLREGEDELDGILREAWNVRSAAGLCDVSTLGKIELIGPDAPTFLDRLYVNGMARLAVGRARYGLMLREDGLVFDDGTVSRLAEQRWVVTTTTANAAAVLAHMERHHQCVWPELDVAFASVTEQWAQIALAGPRAREVLAAAVPGADVSNAALPFMGVIEVRLEGVPLRIFRISFSGELAFELAVPAGYGEALWERLLAAGERFGIMPYGTEALNVLRVEKGHVAGAELDGRTTAHDLGLGRMVSTRKDFVGRALAPRPALIDLERPALVGLRPVDRSQHLRAGAHLVASPRAARKGQSLGWVTSVAPSPTLGHWIGLGLARGGLEQHRGQRLVASFPLKGEAVAVEVVSPHFVDPDGERLRA